MTDITPSSARIQQEAEDFRSPVSEASMFAIGGGVNECLDRTDTQATQIAALQATDAEYAPKIYQRGFTHTVYSYSLTEPFSETLIATNALTVRANPSANAIVALNFLFNEAYASASYNITTVGGISYQATFRVTRQINAGSQVNIVNLSNTGSLTAESGTFFSNWKFLQKNLEFDTFTNTSDSTVTYRVFVDFNVTVGIIAAATFSATDLVLDAIQLR